MNGSSVIADLDFWGPETAAAPLSLIESQRYCRRLATSHYENFPVVSWLLPQHLHQHFYNVYAYCRWADDLGDEAGDRTRSRMLLRWWKTELQRCYAGEATHPVFIALAPTIQKFSIPQKPFADLISAFLQDQEVRQYDSMDQLLDYCSRSANPVGRIVLALCERATPENMAWSDSICTGLQLANFWQDVSRDYNIGRVYLPRDVRERFGYNEADLNARRTTPEFQQMMRFLVSEARRLLNSGWPLVARMPGRIKWDIELFIRGGLLILLKIERIECRVWEHRPKIHKSDFVWEMLRMLCCLR